jgi:hypothetical protein
MGAAPDGVPGFGSDLGSGFGIPYSSISFSSKSSTENFKGNFAGIVSKKRVCGNFSRFILFNDYNLK